MFHTAHVLHLITRTLIITHFVGNPTVVWMSEMEPDSSFPENHLHIHVSRLDFLVVSSCLLFPLPHDPQLNIYTVYSINERTNTFLFYIKPSRHVNLINTFMAEHLDQCNKYNHSSVYITYYCTYAPCIEVSM